ncbi:MAG: DUF1778 domain-containing protein [Alcanivoracaceae bacterium]|nr:DUF1778 domain-containing protein [Alcanivoracaceae bacterium]
MINARLDVRLSQEIKDKAEKATALLGMKSLTEYVVHLMDENASQVIQQHESITIEDDLFDRFMQTCEKVQTPNKALLEAARLTKELGIK